MTIPDILDALSAAFENPFALLLLPLALLPWFVFGLKTTDTPALVLVPAGALSTMLHLAFKGAASFAAAALILGLGGLSLPGHTVERVGEGAHIVLLLDRSASMDNTFAGEPPAGGAESKSAAARRLLGAFVKSREHDFFGVAAFSTSPLRILPISDHKEAVLAAIEAMTEAGLALTDVGRGLAMALSLHEEDPSPAARAILLVSDGAAVMSRTIQEKLRAAFARRPVNLYWLFLRTKGSKGLADEPAPGEADTPQVLPERHLDKFLKTLGVPYRAFEAGNPEAVANAIAEIGKLERRPLLYEERIPHRDLAGAAYGAAALALLVPFLAALAAAITVASRERSAS